MKNLSKEELKSLDLPKAWEIAQDFADFMEKTRKPFDFEDNLPYQKTVIQIALLHILSYEDFQKVSEITKTSERALKETIRASLAALNNFIPNPSQYATLLEIVKKSEM